MKQLEEMIYTVLILIQIYEKLLIVKVKFLLLVQEQNVLNDQIAFIFSEVILARMEYTTMMFTDFKFKIAHDQN